MLHNRIRDAIVQHFIMICFSAEVYQPLLFSSKRPFIVFSPEFYFNWMFSKQCSFALLFVRKCSSDWRKRTQLTQTHPKLFTFFSATSEMKYNGDSRTKKTSSRKTRFGNIRRIFGSRTLNYGAVAATDRWVVSSVRILPLASRRCQVFTAKCWPTKVTSGSIARTSPIFELLGLLVRLKLSLSHYWGIQMSHCQASSSEKALFKPRSIYH